MSESRYPLSGTLGTRVTVVIVGLLVASAFLSHQLFQRVGRRAIDAEIANYAYDQAGWIAESLEKTLDKQGKPTADTRSLLQQTAVRRNLSLVLLVDADEAIATAHGPALAKALKKLKNLDANGNFTDSGDRPWIPSFGDDSIDPQRWPVRYSRSVQVQPRWPFAVETPIRTNLSLSVVPLALEPVKGTGFGVGLFVIFALLGLSGVLASGRLMLPLVGLTRDVENAAREPGRPVKEQPVAELEAIARQVRLMGTSAQRAKQQRDSAFGAVAGQLRPALAELRGHLAAIDPDVVPPALQDPIEGIGDGVRSSQRVVESLAGWFELETRKRALSPAPNDVRQVVDGALEAIAEEFGPDRVKVRVEDAVDEQLDLDVAAVQEVLLLLVRNALEHGGTEAAIHVTRAGNKVEFAVLDRGPGIDDPDELRQIWQPFFRGSTAKGPGLGVGLRVARQLVELHSGGLRGRNHPQGGFETSFWLPAPPLRVTAIDRGLTSVDWDGGGERKDLAAQKQESLLPPKPRTSPGAPAPVVTAGDPSVSAEEETLPLPRRTTDEEPTNLTGPLGGAEPATKAAPKSASTKKASAKKASTKKASAKKASAKKASAKKASAKKASAKKASAKKASAKKASAKKAEPDPLSPDPDTAPPLTPETVASLVPKSPDETSGEDDPYAPF